MTNDQTGRTPRQTTGGSPAASTIMIIVTVVAVVIGFFILKSIRDDDGGTSGSPPATAGPGGSTTTSGGVATTAPPTTAVSDVKTGTSVEVANASGVGGAAGKTSDELKSGGFTMAAATNSTGPRLDVTVVYYDPTNPAALPVASTVARTMGVAAPGELPAPIPITGGKLGEGVGVLVMLGKDKAGKTLAQMSPTTVAGATATTAAAGATTTTKAG